MVINIPHKKERNNQIMSGPVNVNSGNPGTNLKITFSVLLKAKRRTIEKILILKNHINIFILLT
tara:strand:+ start:515 stop:706 length:192 start_codon:yes stop_codon:yes gene_type:complete